LDAPKESPNTIILRIDGRIDRADVAGLCDRVRTLLAAGGADLVVCDVSRLVAPDAVAVDALARMQLTAHRLGHGIRLRHACPYLVGLIFLSGLSDAVRSLPD
jgi:ABC-type transporter Mla MlaB component